MIGNSLTAYNVDDLAGIARTILVDMADQRVFALKGVMGAGKTTLIKSFCDFLGVEEVVSSPTFALVNEYLNNQNDSVYHFDFYRIKKIEEVFDIGYEEYFFSGNYCFIEWPELVESLLPENYVQVNIKVGEEEEREITYSTSEPF